jgi:hypothetical protein
MQIEKKEIKKIIFIFLIHIVFMIFLCLGIFIVFLKSSTPTPIQNNNIIHETCEEQIDNITIFDKIEKIAENVSLSHKYILHQFDCSDFSKALIVELNKSNISAYCIYSIYKGQSFYPFHTFVAIDINNITYFVESTQGYFMDNATINSYKILNFCCIMPVRQYHIYINKINHTNYGLIPRL